MKIILAALLLASCGCNEEEKKGFRYPEGDICKEYLVRDAKHHTCWIINNATREIDCSLLLRCERERNATMGK